MLPLVLLVLLACQGGSNESYAASPERPPVPQSSGLVNIPIHSYNYTDRTISSFYVNGTWGGNVFISRGNAGGGKSACCVRWYSGMEANLPKKYRVRWIADMCKYQVEEGGGVFDRYRAVWKEQDAYLTELPPGKPKAFEVHFYRDGHVEVAMSEQFMAHPRLKLPYDE
ncbi:DUF3304 domain-containing protein, partial [Stenotrophomonas sp. MMGLT7]|nr:DUF3304 domain-containing protein [Stenotrophomonas sp. MMGLT7]